MKRSGSKIKPPEVRKSILSILVISVIILILDLVFFALAITRSASDWEHADHTSLYSVYWLGLPVLLTAIIGIIAGIRKQKALVVGYMVLCIITSLLAATMAILFMLVVYIICGSFFDSGRVGRDGKSCDFKDPNRAIYITMVTDAVLVFICCLIGSICACYHSCSCCSKRARNEPEVITLTPLSAQPIEDPFAY